MKVLVVGSGGREHAIVGLNDLMRASRMKGVRASLGDAPFPNR